uniref:BLOC-1-related complex subunit 7 n=1 Tax=Fundulus heteroclitus TaxID=8078 RepID=A0A3Q2Q5B8_FUNHE
MDGQSCDPFCGSNCLRCSAAPEEDWTERLPQEVQSLLGLLTSGIHLLGQAARNMVIQEDAILHSEDSLRKMSIITTHLQYQQEAIQKKLHPYL